VIAGEDTDVLPFFEVFGADSTAEGVVVGGSICGTASYGGRSDGSGDTLGLFSNSGGLLWCL